MQLKLFIALFLSLISMYANANIPDHINALVFEKSGFKKYLTIKIPLEDSRKLLEKVRTTDYNVFAVQPFLSSEKVNPIFLRYLVKNQYAEIIHEDWKSRGSRDPMFFLFYSDELFKKLPDVRECGQTWCVHIGKRELASIEYTNSYKGNVFGYETDVYAVVFKYKLTSSLPHLALSTVLYTGKAKAYLDLDDGTWKLINYELEDEEEQSILDQMSNDYPEFEFNVQNTLVKTSVTNQTQQQNENTPSSQDKFHDPIEVFNDAMTVFKNQEFAKASLLFTKAIDSQSLTGIDELIAYMKRGEVYEQMEDIQKAINDYSVALEKLKSIEGLKGYKAEFYYRRGYLNEQLDQKQLALNDYSIAIKNDSNYLRAFNNRANLYFESEQYGKAISDLDKYIQGDKKGWPQAYYIRGMAKLILEQHEESAKDLRIAASLGYEDAQTALDKQNIQWQGAFSIYEINNVLDQCQDVPEQSTRIVVILTKKTESMKSLKALGMLGEEFLVVSNESIMEGLSNGGLIFDERQFNFNIGDSESKVLLKSTSGSRLAHEDIETQVSEIFLEISFGDNKNTLNWNDSDVFSIIQGQCMILNLVDLQIESELSGNSDKIYETQKAILFNTENVPRIHSQPLHFRNPNLAFKSTFDQGLIGIIKQSSETTLGKCRAELAKHIWSMEKFELVERAASIFASQLSISSLDDVMADKLETDLLLELSRIILDQPQSIDQSKSFMNSVIGYLMTNVVTSTYVDGKELNKYLDVNRTVDLITAFNLILKQEQLQYFEIKNIVQPVKTNNETGQNDLDIKSTNKNITSAKLFYNPYSRYLLVVVKATCKNSDESVYVFLTEVEKLFSKAIPISNTFKALEF